jgi:P pilus assembly chaperone PapD
MNKVTIAFATCIAMVLCAGIAAAGGCSLEVSPLTLELQVDPGHAYTGTVELNNTGPETQHVKAYCQDWALKPDGLVVFLDAGTLPQSASPWVTLSPTEFDLEGGASAQIRFTIRPPADASSEFRTVIIFEGIAQEMTLRGAPSRIVPRLGTVLYLQCGPAAPPQARISQFQVTPDGGTIAVENAGPGHLRFTGKLEISRSGQLVRSTNLEGFVVLPAPFSQHRTTVAKEATAGLAPGDYEVVAILDCGGPSLLGARTTLSVPRPATTQ